jgi:hypothetical protein
MATTDETDEKKKDRVNVLVPKALGDRLRNAVDALSGPPHRLRLNATCEEALLAHVEKLEKKFNKGEPFPQRAGPLRQGGRV